MARNGTQVINPGYKPYYVTGSDEQLPFCLEEGTHAATTYGVSVQTYGGNCLVCASSIQIVLDFNSVGGADYFARCPICNSVWRHLNSDGSLSDFKIITLGKKPVLEAEYNEGNPAGRGWY
jgi:hypothetical protein